MLTPEKRYEYRHTIDLIQYGFEKIGNYAYRHEKFFSVELMENFAIFSSKRYTKAVEYDKIETYLNEIGLIKNTINQGSPKSGDK